MLNHTLKVYGEDLINGSIAGATVSGSKVVAAGHTEGALCLNVFAVGAVATDEAVTITVTHGDSENGDFATLMTITIAADKSFADGELIDSVILPMNTKAYIAASAVSDADNSGSIRVTLGYLPR